MRIHVQLNYGLDAEKYAARHAAGLVADVAPYGFHHARQFEKEVTFSRDRDEGRLGSVIRRAIRRAAGLDFLHAWHNRKAILEADVVWTMIDSDYLAVAALCILTGRKRRPAIIGNNVWLFEHLEHFGPLRRWLYRRLIRRVDLLTVHSRNYLPIAAEFVPDARTELMYFGISCATFVPTRPRDETEHSAIRIVAAGNDPTRDWPTVLAAFAGDPRFELVIVSNKVRDADVAAFDNVRLPRNPTMAEFKDLYEWADFTVVPMRENKYSGITVALEAAAMGGCVVSSRTGGVPTYFDEGEVLYCRPGDPDDLRNVVVACTAEKRRAVAEKGRQRFLDSGYCTEDMIRRYHDASLRLLSKDRALA
ncbi:Glycosyltransferase [Hartmannibacter diazotrophicus]|uniref:Glycosyltransferase n=1 Tax=Hartmannibacter diazotrophicus TaxID=1482074 RepID=A0A2C9D7S1_9HYPH|nr:glycosyltransferase family 4 protein [Hartmannibacter diazotrophicus]SON56219.1 Glycosyltransferase [Hartmannibacter diazotrophicus]